MKIKTCNLTSFLTKALMEGTQKITEAKLVFDTEGMSITKMSLTGSARVDALLMATAFTELDYKGTIALSDLDKLLKILAQFEPSKDIEITTNNNILKISQENKTVEMEMIDESFIKTEKPVSNTEYDETFTIETAKLQLIFTDALINTNPEIIITTTPNVVTFKNTGRYKFTTSIISETTQGQHKSKYGMPIIDALKKLTGEVTLSFKNNGVLKAEENTDLSTITILVAPMTEVDG